MVDITKEAEKIEVETSLDIEKGDLFGKDIHKFLHHLWAKIFSFGHTEWVFKVMVT